MSIARILGVPNRASRRSARAAAAALAAVVLVVLSIGLHVAARCGDAPVPAATAEPSRAALPAHGASQTEQKPLADQVADCFAAHLASLRLSFPSEDRLAALRKDVREFTAKYEPADMPAAEKERLLAGVDRYLARQFQKYDYESVFALEERTYLSLPDKLRTFEWMLWVSLTRKPLTTEQAKAREEQRKWLREFLEKVPVRPGDSVPEGLREVLAKVPVPRDEGLPAEGAKPEQVRPWAVEQVELCFSDPFSLLYDPLSEKQFENFKRILGYSAWNGLRSTVVDLPSRVLQARVQLLPETSDQSSDVLLPFNDKAVAIPGSGTDFVLFASNERFNPQDRFFFGFGLELRKVKRGVFDAIGGTRIEVPAEIAGEEPDAPAVVGWLKRQGKGDLVYLDGPATLRAVRGARLAVLSVRGWIEADKLSDAELRTQIAEQGKTSVSAAPLRGVNGVRPFGADDPRIVVAVETAEKRLAVAILKNREFGGLYFGCRARPAGGGAAAAKAAAAGIRSRVTMS
jgi:hypothetical protein